MRLRGLLFSTAFLLSCGGEPEPAAPRPLGSATAKKPVAPTFDVSEVAAPAGLIGTAEARSPKGSVDELVSWFGLPSLSLSKIGKALTHEDIGEALDPAKPVYAALTFQAKGGGSMEVEAALTLGLRPFSESRPEIERRFRLIEKEGGVYLLESKRIAEAKTTKRDGDDDDDDDTFRPKDRCGLFPAYERESLGGMRLVCAESEQALLHLGPYLTRTATRTAPKHDLHAKVVLTSLRDTFEQGRALLPMLSNLLSLGGASTKKGALPPSTRWIQSVLALGDDLVTAAEDIEAVEIQGDAGKDGAVVEGMLHLKSVEATTTKVFMSRADVSPTAPPTFFRLPSDASSAWYSMGFDEKLLSGARTEMRASIADAYQAKKLPAADATAAANIGDSIVHLMSVPHVSATGVDVSALKVALSKVPKDGSKDAHVIQAVTNGATWQVTRYEEPFANLAVLTQRSIAVLRKPSTTTALAEILEKVGKIDPPKLGTAPKELPKGSLRYDGGFTFFKEGDAGGKKGAAAKVKAVSFLAPDGDGTWFATGGDEALVKKKLLEAMSAGGPGSAAGLDARPGLEDLRTTRAASAGFVSLRTAYGLPLLTMLGAGSVAADFDGTTPVPWHFQREVTATGGRLTFRARLPKAAAPEIMKAVLPLLR